MDERRRERITVLTPADLVGVIADVGREFGLTQLTIETYDDSREVVGLYETHLRQTDAFLLGGPIAYHHLLQYLDASGTSAKVPIQFIPYNEVSIYRALFELAHAHDFRGPADLSVSIDHPAGEDVRSCIDEIQLKLVGLVSHEVTISEKIDELVAFHYDLWKSGEISAMLTSVYYVYRRMCTAGAPVYRISPARSSIRSALRAAISDVKELGRRDKQIAVMIVRFTDSASRAASSTAYQVHKRRLALDHLLRSFGDSLQGLVQWSETNEVSIVSTRERVESKLEDATFELLQEIFKSAQVPAVAGVGFADAAHDALDLCIKAVGSAEAMGRHSVVAADADGTMRRQSMNGQILEYGRWSDEPNVLALSKRAGLGVATINKVAAHAQQSSKPFTASCIASSLGITPRSARRVLSRLEAAGFIERVGEEQPMGSGRPRRMFRLSPARQDF